MKQFRIKYLFISMTSTQCTNIRQPELRLKKPAVSCRKKKILAAYKVSAYLATIFAKVPKIGTFLNIKCQTSNENFLIGWRSKVTSLLLQ